MEKRASGILLHPTSLPGRLGIGDLGRGASRFLDWLEIAGQSIWQVLPLGPVGTLNSPYDSASAFAGNPLLISAESLGDSDLIPQSALDAAAPFPPEEVDFDRLRPWKDAILRTAWENFSCRPHPELAERYAEFLHDPLQTGWLDDWTLFTALRAKLAGAPWYRWPTELRHREPKALGEARQELRSEIDFQSFVQFLFFDQWAALRREARRRGIRIFGDLAIYVALDSVDVWSHQEIFDLSSEGLPVAVAGVPPDYFSKTGQLWGNPLYRWDRLKERQYDWWAERLRSNLRLADLVRIDHFRGFAEYWEVPAGAETAAEGHWRIGPGEDLFAVLRDTLGTLPIVAEDLGIITPSVRDLLRSLGIPGMKVLQFAFGEPDSDHLPHHHVQNLIVYTGTHDNDTAKGWFERAGESERRRALDYLGGDADQIHWSLIRAANASVADTAIVPMQDVLGLGSEARMNFPGKGPGQWRWRLTDLPDREPTERLLRLVEATGRLPSTHGPEKASAP
jgi:4-alpha-glucanotransferase